MRYRTIVADPPWRYEKGFWQTSHDQRTGALTNPKRVALPYASMSVPDICALPIADLAESDAILYLWTTSRYIRDSFDVIDAWGFQYRQIIVWSKPKDRCLPASVAPIHAEFLMVGIRGNPCDPRRTSIFPSSVIQANRTKQHSRKPDVFLDYIEAASPAPYVELFARRQRLGWDTWGNEALPHVEMRA